MKESQFGFEYTWEDLQPIRTLAVIAFAFQIGGALLGLWMARYPQWFANLWAGGAIATFPGFMVGLVAQKLKDPESLTKNKVMVRRFGLIAVVLTLSAFVVPFE